MQGNSVVRAEAQHFDGKVWMKELHFYRDELKLFEHHLEKLVSKHPRDLLPKIEHFQNQFIRQHEVLDELLHELRLSEDALFLKKDKSQKIIADPIPDHHELQVRMDRFIDLFTELKNEFVLFVQEL